MEQGKYNYLGDSYIEIEGNENQVTQFISDISNGKIQIVLSTKISHPYPSKTPTVKLTKKYLKKSFSK